MASTGKLQSDGTRCYKGPGCKRHGASSDILRQIQALKTEVSRSPVSTATKKHPLFPKDRSIRRGINNPEDRTVLDDFDKEASSFRKGLNDKSDDAVRDYTMGFYDPINRYLRRGEIGIDEYYQHDFKEQISAENKEFYLNKTREHIASLDKLIQKHDASNKQERVLYKGYRVRMPDGAKTTPEHIDKHIEESYKVGQVLTNKAYTSVSMDSDYMLAFAHRDPENIIVHEIVSKNGIPLHDPEDSNGSVQGAEREVLLPRDSKFKVVGITEATFESTYPSGVPTCSTLFRNAPKKRKFKIIQMVEID